MKDPNNRLRCKDILATEIVEDLTEYLETFELMRELKGSPHDPEADRDIRIFKELVDIVKDRLSARVREFEDWRDG